MTTDNKMTIENKSWPMDILYDNYPNIGKPKFQRDKRWTILPKKDNIANYKHYIEFLIKNGNSVFPISLGTEIVNNNEAYIVIDGNNRINAIIWFLKKPYDIFPEYYIEMFEFINNSTATPEQQLKYTNEIKTLTYRTISTFRRLNNVIHGYDGPIELFQKLEDELITIQNKLLLDSGKPFDSNTFINVNIFKNGSYEEYSKIFEDINKHSNTLHDNELLSAILSSVNIDIVDHDLKYCILTKISEFYESRGKDEVLDQYKFKMDMNERINAFDFMVGFQNYCNHKYYVIPTYESSGLSLFFKIFKTLYGTISSSKFTQVIIDEFIEKITFSSEILSEAFNSIFPSNINENLFNKAAVKCNSFIKKNALCILLISNIASRDMMSKSKLITETKKCIIYHMFCNSKFLKNIADEERLQFTAFDSIEYRAGGSFISNKCNTIINTNHDQIFDKITRDKFKHLLESCLYNTIQPCSFEEKPKARRKLNLLDKILMATYWNRNIPNKFISNVFSNEHITPFSSIFSGEIDIDRVGNMFPSFDDINKRRGNKDLTIYKEECPEFYESIKVLLPVNYNAINVYKERKTTICLNDDYNKYCENNEKLMIDNLLDELYR